MLFIGEYYKIVKVKGNDVKVKVRIKKDDIDIVKVFFWRDLVNIFVL